MLDRNKVKLGIAPIAWTNDDMPDLGAENTFEQCVSEMALAGFTGTEVGNRYPKDTAALKKALSLRGLEICNQWFSSFILTKDFAEVEKDCRAQLAFLKEMGSHIIGFSEQSYSVQGRPDTPIFGHKYVMGDEEWKRLCDGLDRLGRIALEEYGINLTYHHHMGTVVQSAEETDRLMEGTDPRYCSLLFDSGHFAYCSEDPVAVLSRHKERVRHVHLKNIRPLTVARVRNEGLSFLDGVRAGAFTVPGDTAEPDISGQDRDALIKTVSREGLKSVDFESIFRILDEHGYEGYMLVEAEQDPAKANPLEYAMRARAYIRDKTGL